MRVDNLRDMGYDSSVQVGERAFFIHRPAQTIVCGQLPHVHGTKVSPADLDNRWQNGRGAVAMPQRTESEH